MMTAKELMDKGYRLIDVYWVSPVKAMRSAAGWYAGTDCYEMTGAHGLVGPMPYERITGYYGSDEGVEAVIKLARERSGEVG